MGRTKWKRSLIALVVVSLAAACTTSDSGPEEPTAESAARDFVSAWAGGDYAAMVELFDADETWTADEFEQWMERALRRGQVTSFQVATAGRVTEPETEGDASSAPYEITYESAASTAPVVLSGTFELELDEDSELWRPQWDNGMLWPGIEGATAFKVTTTWPDRAPILDREGRELATGPAALRSYPYGSTGGSVIGHIEPLTKADARERETGQAGDLVGGSGLEKAFDEILAGQPQTTLSAVDSTGKRLQILGFSEGRDGRRVRSTLDIDVQSAAESAYGDTVGGVAVIDPRTGDILAAVGSGTFDPNSFVGAAEIHPFNRALLGRYPPGSSMKVVTAAAALEEDVVTTTTLVTGPKEYLGVRNFESGKFGAIPFSSALKYSVNTAFAQVAEDLGAERMIDYAEAFGFNRVPEMPLEAAEPSFPPPASLGDLMWASIGQAQVLATPLQMATVAGTIANRGRRMEPRIDFRTRPSGERAVSRTTAAEMTTLMEDVVIGGTGSAARVTGLRIAGKTGTAEIDVDEKRKDHAWFICFAPVEDPRVAIAVVSEFGGIGGKVAAPIARQVLISVLPYIE
jgi:penicillin-binding protein A